MSFADFPEQTQVVKLLQRSLERGRLAHAYLFTGDRLDELEAMAGTLAKTLNCRQPVRREGRENVVDSCDLCLSCRKIDNANHPDIQWVRPESKSRVITIEQMRELMQTVHLKPTEAEFKVAVIVAADRLNIQAANAFLKTLEEPPAKSILVLLSTEPQRVLETILSRCLRLHFAGENGRQIENPALTRWIATFGDMAATEQKGLLGRYRLLGVLLARLAELKTETTKSLTDRSPLERYNDVEPRLREKWEEELAAAIEAEYRRQRTDLLVRLEWWLRDVWLHTLSLGEEMMSFPQLAPTAKVVAKRISPDLAAQNLCVLEETQRLLGSNVQEALALEVGFLKLKL